MHPILMAAGLTALLATATGTAAAQTETFEDLVEDALERNAPGANPAQPPATAVPPRLGIAPAPLQPAGDEQARPPLPQPVTGLPALPAISAEQPGADQPGAQPPPPKPYTPPSLAAPAETLPADGAPSAPATALPETAVPERSQASLTVNEVNAATFSADAQTVRGASPLVLKAQILLDRAGASPGVIDAIYGGNVAKAIAAVETVLDLPADGQLDPEVWAALGGDAAPPVLVEYVVTQADADYPFLDGIPADYAVQATLPALGFTSPEEMFGERFHMDVKLFRALNPEADLRRPGAVITIADINGQPVAGKIARIEADKGSRQVRAYDVQDRLVVAYPATIGSSDNPSPAGTHQVNTVAPNPVYYYNPANFVQGENRTRLELPPGPNNPVGTMWIDLSEPSYGIHGTPEPSRIDKTGSHGCIRLTNWDAEELATLVEPGIPVSFTE